MDIDVGRALETDFVHLRDEMGEQELEYLRRTRAFVQDEMLPVIGGHAVAAYDAEGAVVARAGPSSWCRTGW